MLRADSVSVSFGSRRVLSGLTLSFAPGSITALVGPNGVGKTTLLRALLGVLPPDRGSVTLDGEPVRSIPHRLRARRLAYLPHTPAVSFGFSTLQVVAMGRPGVRATQGSAGPLAALDRVGLADRARDPFGILSAGQRQRVSLARVLYQLGADRPGVADSAPTRVLLADEPTGAMDPAHEVHACEVFRELAASGVAVVAVLHDLTLAARLATDAVVLDPGRPEPLTGPADATLTAETLGRVFGTPFIELNDDSIGRAILTDPRGASATGSAPGRPSAAAPPDPDDSPADGDPGGPEPI